MSFSRWQLAWHAVIDALLFCLAYMRCCFCSSVFCPMLCIYKNERAKGKIFCPRPLHDISICLTLSKCDCCTLRCTPWTGEKKTVHGVEGGKHCHHEYSSDADLGFIRRHVLSFSNQTFFVKELKENFTVPSFASIPVVMLMLNWKLDIMKCVNASYLQ